MPQHSRGLGCTGTPVGCGSWSATLPWDRRKGQGQPTLRAAWWELQELLDGEQLPFPSLVWAGPTALLRAQAVNQQGGTGASCSFHRRQRGSTVPIPQFLVGTGMTVILNGNSSLCRGLPSTGLPSSIIPFWGTSGTCSALCHTPVPAPLEGFRVCAESPEPKGPTEISAIYRGLV